LGYGKLAGQRLTLPTWDDSLAKVAKVLSSLTPLE
jgi:hypothetical protein